MEDVRLKKNRWKTWSEGKYGTKEGEGGRGEKKKREWRREERIRDNLFFFFTLNEGEED